MSRAIVSKGLAPSPYNTPTEIGLTLVNTTFYSPFRFVLSIREALAHYRPAPVGWLVPRHGIRMAGALQFRMISHLFQESYSCSGRKATNESTSRRVFN